jgi:hypothetical protein
VKWRRSATSDIDKLAYWAKKFPGCNWGWAIPTGYVVIDIDGAEGQQTVQTLEAEGKVLPGTLTALTGRGRHLIYRTDAHFPTANPPLGEHVDTRTEGGYVIYSGSVHESGRMYRFVDHSVPVAEAPAWLIERLTARRKPSRARWGDAEAEPSKIQRGQRTNFLVSKAGWLNRRGADLETIEKVLAEHNDQQCLPPLPEDKVRTIAREIPERYAQCKHETHDTQDTHDTHDSQGEMYSGDTTAIETINFDSLQNHVKAVLDFLGFDPGKKWPTRIFNFARLCKGYEPISRLKDFVAMDLVGKALCALAGEHDPWTHYFPEAGTSDECKVDFQHCWRKTLFVPGDDFLAEAAQQAEIRPVYFSSARGALYQKLINIAAHLQVRLPDRTIFLPCRKLEPLLGCSKATVARLCSMAIDDGFLSVERKEDFNPKGRSWAREYRFNLGELSEQKEGSCESNPAILEIPAAAQG